jgi:DNA/RNA endonuclease YhcR with UshA esterase domain
MKAPLHFFVIALVVAPALAQSDTPPVITPNDAAKHVGDVVTVEGQVAAVHHLASAKVTFIDMGARYPNNPFSAVILSADASKFPNVENLEGKTIGITGKVQLYKKSPEILLTDAAQIKIK